MYTTTTTTQMYWAVVKVEAAYTIQNTIPGTTTTTNDFVNIQATYYVLLRPSTVVGQVGAAGRRQQQQ